MGPMQQGSYPMGECGAEHPSRASLPSNTGKHGLGSPRSCNQSSGQHPGGPYSSLCLGLKGGCLWAQVGTDLGGGGGGLFPQCTQG